jgi:predicted ATPase with chaperone activity
MKNEAGIASVTPACRFEREYRLPAIITHPIFNQWITRDHLQCGHARGGIRQFCILQDEGQSRMRAAMTQLNLSASGYHRVLKLARTISDLAGSQEIQSVHLAQALQCRPKLMMG